MGGNIPIRISEDNVNYQSTTHRFVEQTYQSTTAVSARKKKVRRTGRHKKLFIMVI